MWQSFISSVLHASLWYAVLLLQFIKTLFYNSGIHGGLQLFQSFKVALCYSPDWQSRSSSIADPLLGLAAELLLSWDSISVSHRSCLSTVSLCPPSTSAPTAVFRHKQHAAMEQMVADHSLQVSALSNWSGEFVQRVDSEWKNRSKYWPPPKIFFCH